MYKSPAAFVPRNSGHVKWYILTFQDRICPVLVSPVLFYSLCVCASNGQMFKCPQLLDDTTAGKVLGRFVCVLLALQ